MSENTERSLAEKADAEDVRDVAPREVAIDDFLAGVRARRKAVKVRPHLHRFADMERLVDEIDAAPEDANVDDLIDAYEQARAEFEAYEWYVVEQRSQERATRVLRDTAKAHGIELDDEDEPTATGDALTQARATLAFAVWADHVVSPEGVDGDHLRALHESSPESFTLVKKAIDAVGLILDERAEREVLRDFSSRRSSARLTS